LQVICLAGIKDDQVLTPVCAIIVEPVSKYVVELERNTSGYWIKTRVIKSLESHGVYEKRKLVHQICLKVQ